MAIYHLQAKVIQRSQGRSVIAAAAYRAGEALYDEKQGLTQNFLAKTGVVHSEILLPEHAPQRWCDRETLWNEVDAGELRKDAVLAREIEIALPRELSQAEAIRLAQDFVREQFVARGMVADLNVHWGQAGDGGIQPHAHVLLTMRPVIAGEPGQAEGRLGQKERAWNDKATLRSWRQRWAEMANERLAEVGLDLRIDHRSHAAQGLDLEPTNKIGPAGARRAAHGEEAERADEHRAIARRNGERLLANPDLALQALTHQQSTFTRQDLARLVDRQTDGATQFTAVMARVEASPELVRVGQDGRGRDRFSTRDMVAIEQRLIATSVALARRTTHRVNDRQRLAVLDDQRLGEEQQTAYLHVTRSRDLAVVVGIAGGGKSTMLGTARQVWQGQGYRVRGAALSGIAAEGLDGSAGIESRTIASWEYAWDQGQEMLTAKDILVVDEAGMIGSRQLGRVVERVHAAGAKLVLVGDAEQLQAIEAGAAFRAIADRVGVIAITEPRRQQSDWQRMATRHLASARTEAALDRYAAEGLVHRHATREAARAGVIAAWDEARHENPAHSQIILAHERVDVRALNEAAREVRKAAGELGPDHVLATELGSRVFAEGDRLYFLKNERGLGVKNGTLGTLERVDGERLTIRLDGPNGTGKGRAVTVDLAAYAHLDHGYAATVHKNQGATVDQAHVLATPGMDRHLIYVAMSRHRQAVRLHWGEEDFGTAARLRTVLGRERAKDTTLDYAAPELEPAAAYAERRGLNPLMPVSEIVVRPDLVLPALAPDPPEDKVPGVVPPTPARGMFDGLGLSDAPLGAPASVPAPSPLSRAVARYLAADSVLARMNREGLPALPHQRAALDAARTAIETLRPGFTQDLIEVVQRQPALSGPAQDGAAGLAVLIEAAGHLPAERAAETRRRAEQEALAPLRARLLETRMAAWWRETYPYLHQWERSPATQSEAKAVETVLRREIDVMPGTELRRIEAERVRAEQAAAREEALRPRGPSASPGW